MICGLLVFGMRAMEVKFICRGRVADSNQVLADE